MRILFLHNNFPAQFGDFAQYLWKAGWDVWFGTKRKNATLDGVNIFIHEPHRQITSGIHPYVGGFEQAVIHGQSVARAGIQLHDKGLKPDIVMAHSGWGPGLFVKDIWPQTKYVGYFEWYYQQNAPDVEFLRQTPTNIDDKARARMRNAPILLDLASSDAAICPTEFQKSQFPEKFRNSLTVFHDGIDIGYYSPLEGVTLKLPGMDLSGAEEIVTYVARGMEPYRGFPQFMRAIEVLLKRRKQTHVVIVGEDRVAYGKKLPEGESYKEKSFEELDLDKDRIHFTGLLPRAYYRDVLRASSAHVYFTIPFVLSWSMMEAMSAGCAIVASDVAPVREISGSADDSLLLADMNNPALIADCIERLLENRQESIKRGGKARQIISDRYAAKDIYKKKLNWLMDL